MSRNGSGVYSLPPQYLATTGETITALQHNLPLTDIAADLNAVRPISSGGTGSSTASGARANLGIAIGSNVQAYDAFLASIAGLTITADLMIYTTAADTAATTALSAFARTLLDDADAATARATLGVPPATRSVSAGGLATGGGDLSADRTITVTAASQAEAEAGTNTTHVMTPHSTKQAIDANATDLSTYSQFYTGSTAAANVLPIGAIVLASGASSAINKNASATVGQGNPASTDTYFVDNTLNVLGGTWRSRGTVGDAFLMQRTA